MQLPDWTEPMTAMQTPSVTPYDLPAGAPASVWVMFRDHPYYRLCDGTLIEPVAGDTERTVQELVRLDGCQDRLVCGPADALALFSGGYCRVTTRLPHSLNWTASEPVHFGNAGMIR
jgi:hypothetical protein